MSTFRTNYNKIQISIYLTLPWKRYLAVLKRIRNQIKNGSKLELESSTYLGNKYIHSSWGLCSGSTEQWPDKEDRLFPRSSPLAILHQEKGQVCPFDKRLDNHPYAPDGCFNHCRIFQHLDNLPTREEALELYESRIQKVNIDPRLDKEPIMRD